MEKGGFRKEVANIFHIPRLVLGENGKIRSAKALRKISRRGMRGYCRAVKLMPHTCFAGRFDESCPREFGRLRRLLSVTLPQLGGEFRIKTEGRQMFERIYDSCHLSARLRSHGKSKVSRLVLFIPGGQGNEDILYGHEQLLSSLYRTIKDRNAFERL